MASVDRAHSVRDVVEEAAPLPVAFQVESEQVAVVVGGRGEVSRVGYTTDNNKLVLRVVNEAADVLFARRTARIDWEVALLALGGRLRSHQPHEHYQSE